MRGKINDCYFGVFHMAMQKIRSKGALLGKRDLEPFCKIDRKAGDRVSLMESSNHQKQPNRESSTEDIPKSQTPYSEGFPLPNEITCDILSRLSVPTVLLCRSVCKIWSHLTRTDTFIHQHLRNFGENETDHGFINMRRDFYEYTLEYSSKGHSRSVKIDEKTPEPYWVSNNCHGLVCAYNEDICNVTILIINPAVDDTFVELPDVGITKGKVLNVCLCYDDQTNKYKVVRFYCPSDGKGTGIEVLTLGDSTWRQLGEVPTLFRGSTPQCLGGAMHWLTYEDKIFFFKTAEETFGLIECPVGDADDDDIIMRMRKDINLTVYEGCLCIVRTHWHPWKLSFFVMKDYVNHVWIEHVIDVMKIDETPFSNNAGFDHCCKLEPFQMQNGKLLLEKEDDLFRSCSDKKLIYYYNPKTECFENHDGTPRMGYQYKESFVSARRICKENY
ncbi:hypothetical protein LUZ63_016779 [Rhynchospora breviuscula]|uniref:F-box domain-containing protein n=1 Tax=Rhynchospora breviuscula TaxID=2022672 RepID=A0A9P9ZAI5_9POAL|nr:hypothetical protein LUZ63_016779 [Rhynchospora breviuscula]